MSAYYLLALLGVAIGLFGTLIGAGGGFMLTPILLLLYPHEDPDTITSISLTVTFANVFSGSIAYARMRRVNFKYGLLFATASIPGAITGAFLTHIMPRKTFDLVFAVFLIIASLFIFFKTPQAANDLLEKEVRLSPGKTRAGIVISFFAGMVASFLGIGGGIIHVPILAGVLQMPIHIATATSHFILSIVTLTGVVVHITTGAFQHGFRRTIALVIGALIGAQIGARLSVKVKGKIILRLLAVALFFVGIRILSNIS